jgi:transposase, IS5 family
MRQMTLAASSSFEVLGRAARKAEFLARMNKFLPWSQFCSVIEPHYPKAGNGRPPIGLERMLRTYFVANWFNLADATTLLNFRHLLEAHELGGA